MDQLIGKIADFYEGLLASLTKGGFASTSVAVVFWLFALLATVRFFFAWRRFTQSHSGDIGELFLTFFTEGAKIHIVWFLVMAAPVIFSTMGSAVTGSLSGKTKGIASASQNVLNTLNQSIQGIWATQGVLASRLAGEYPKIFDGMQDANDVADGAMSAEDAARTLKRGSRQLIQQQLADAKKMSASSNSKVRLQGQRLETQAGKQLSDLDQGLNAATSARQAAFAEAKEQNEFQDSEAGESFLKLRSFAAGASLGLSELLFLIRRCLAALVSFVILLPALLLALMAAWKLIQAVIGVLSHLVTYIAVVSLASAFGVALGPLAMVSLLSEEWKRYGHAYISFWLQALAGSLSLVVGLGLAIGGIAALAGMAASSGSLVIGYLVGSSSGFAAFLPATCAGLGFMASGFAFDFFSRFIEKAPTSGIGLISGSFHP